jgi:hypothetical protein
MNHNANRQCKNCMSIDCTTNCTPKSVLSPTRRGWWTTTSPIEQCEGYERKPEFESLSNAHSNALIVNPDFELLDDESAGMEFPGSNLSLVIAQ